jgi:hypothetical protein
MGESELVVREVVKVDPARPEQHHLFHVSPTLDESRVLNPRPVYISLELEPSAFRAELGGFTNEAESPFGRPKSVFDSALRAPNPSGGSVTNLIWFFRGDSFRIYKEGAEGQDELHEPTQLADNTGSSFTADWPPAFAAGLDAVVQGTGPFQDNIWFFKGPRYFRIRLIGGDGAVDINPTPITDGWNGVSGEFATGIDAGIHGVGEFFGFVWLFKGSQYIRYDLNTQKVDVEPHPILGRWGGDTWPEEFRQGIDFAFYGTGDQAEKIYFCRGDKYILYNLRTDRVEEGPTSILKNWPLLSRFIPPPQLFLREEYELRTFRGEMGAGPLVEGTSPKVPARGKTTFFILTKRSETISKATETNILESSSDEAVTRMSEMTRRDETKSESHDDFDLDYQLSSSFRGPAALSLILVNSDTSADTNTKSHATDVRGGYVEAVRRATNHLTNETHQTHKQQVSVADESHVVNVEVETGFIQTIDNSDNPNNLNIEMFQLTQEYIAVTSLVDAKLSFHNEDPREARTVPIREMNTLLAECIVDEAARERIAATIADVLANIVDHTGQTRSLLTPTTGADTRVQVDPALTTTFDLKKSDGTSRSFVVDGIVMNIDRPVVMTPNTELALIDVP